jgi:hypothetical protein
MRSMLTRLGGQLIQRFAHHWTVKIRAYRSNLVGYSAFHAATGAGGMLIGDIGLTQV